METLNIQLQPFFEWLLRTTLQASLMVCLILLLQRILRSRLGIRWHYGLWLLLLVRMSLPWAPQSRASLFNLIPRTAYQQQTEYIQSKTGEQSIQSDVKSTASVESVPASPAVTTQKSPEVVSAAPPINRDVQQQFKPDFSRIFKILPLLWLIGAMVLAVYVCAGNFNLWRIVKRRRPLTDQKILDLLEDCKSQMGIQTILGIVTTDKVKSPALFGFVRPRLLLPAGMVETLSQQELRFVFLHELAHLKRRDIYIGWLISVLQVLHWFNPLVWLAFRRMRADRELACDALVLDRTQSDEPKSYGRIIVSLLERFSCPRFMPGMAGIMETKSQLKRRITMIARFKKNSYQWSPLAVILIIILACVSLPDAVHTKASQTSAKEPAPPIMIRRVWADADGNLQGAPSPDGRYISYVDWDTGGDLAIYEIATGKKRRLTNKDTWDESGEYAEFSKWSPDGKQIVYDWYNEDDFIELRIVGLDGSKPRILYRNEEVDWAQTYDWSPDGKQILACFSRKDGPEQIVLVSVADGSERILKTFDSKWPDKMCFSPDGHYIVYDFSPKEDYLNRDIFLLSIDGNREIPLVEHPADDRVLGWSPDGKNILFASDRTGSPDIWTISITDGNPRGVPELVRPSKGPFSPIGLGFTRDGSFYYGNRTNRTDVYIAEIDSITGKIIVPPKEAINRFVESNGTPDYSPDGKYLAYVSRRPPMPMRYTTSPIGNVLCVRSLEADEEREFRPDINVFGWPRWSPDGRSVMVVAWNEEHQMGYYQIDAQTGNVTPLLPPDGRILSGGHDWSVDGKTIYYGRRDSNTKKFQVCVRNLESGIEKVLYGPDERFNISLSPDGRWLALLFSSNVKQSLNVIPTSGGEPRELCRYEKEDGIVFGRNCAITWTSDGKYILYTMVDSKLDDPGWELCRISAEGGEPQKLGLKMDEFVNLSVHPDGRHITFSSRGQSSSEVWVMENFLPGTPVAKPEPAPEPALRRIEVRGRGSVHSIPSFDGKYMLDVDKETGNLVARELATGKERLLTNNTDPNWFVHGSLISRDSKKAAFYHYNPDKDDFDLRIVGLDGSNLRTLLGAETAGYFNMDAWSPDGKHIFGMLMKKPVQLVRLSTDDGSIEVLKTFDQGKASRIDISPNGRYVTYSYAEQENLNPDIFIFDLEQNKEAPLVTHTASDKLLGWTPDGQNVFFTSDRNGTWDGWLLHIEDGKGRGLPEVIKPGIGDVYSLGFTHSGSFYYSFQHEAWNVYTATLNSNTGEVASDPKPVRHVGSDIRPDWSPDGRYIAYLSEIDRNKPQIIRIRTLATGQEQELKIDIPRFDWLRWCPDSRHLLITSFKWGSPSIIYKVDVQTGEHSALVQSDKQRIRGAELSADGKTLAYRIRGTGNTNWLIVRDMENGREKELLRTGAMEAITLSPFGAGWALSPDGKHMALSVREGETDKALKPLILKIMSVESEKAQIVAGPSICDLTWTSDGHDLLFVKNGKELWRISAEGGEPRKLWEWSEMLWGPRIHPDGQSLAFFSGGYVSEMWVMENFLPTTAASASK